jgi:hypothetical protein
MTGTSHLVFQNSDLRTTRTFPIPVSNSRAGLKRTWGVIQPKTCGREFNALASLDLAWMTLGSYWTKLSLCAICSNPIGLVVNPVEKECIDMIV